MLLNFTALQFTYAFIRFNTNWFILLIKSTKDVQNYTLYCSTVLIFWTWNLTTENVFVSVEETLNLKCFKITFLISMQPCRIKSKCEKCRIWHPLPFCDTVACSYTGTWAKTDPGCPFTAVVRNSWGWSAKIGKNVSVRSHESK